VSAIMPEIVLIPLINWKLNAAKLLPVAIYLKTQIRTTVAVAYM
jgi:hypothetical protein